jgi:hypothetical protein
MSTWTRSQPPSELTINDFLEEHFEAEEMKAEFEKLGVEPIERD